MYGLFITVMIASCKCNNSSNQPSNLNEEAKLQTTVAEKYVTESKNTTTSDEASSINKMFLSEEELKKEIGARKNKASTSQTINGFYPEGSERKLTEYDIQFLSAWGHKVMLNEIYARHGMIFADEMLQRHFKGQKWYKPLSNNVFNKLTKIEKQNISFLIYTEPQSR
jgi:hypothetical protein